MVEDESVSIVLPAMPNKSDSDNDEQIWQTPKVYGTNDQTRK
jgi:hypothetical protein